MKIFIYIIAVLLIVVWVIMFMGFNSSKMVHLLLVVAGFMILLRILFNKKLSKK